MSSESGNLVCDRAQTRHYFDQVGTYYAVSQVLDVICDSRMYPPWAAQQGTDLHEIFALLIGHYAGKCDPPSVPDEYAGHAASIQRWIEEVKPGVIEIEQPHKHRQYPYAGTIDLIADIGGRPIIVDYKSGVHTRRHKVQVQAYMRMISAHAEGALLYSDPDGKRARLVRVPRNARDWSAFICGLSILQWRELP